MSQRIGDIPTHNAAPSGASKVELENPTGPNSEYTTLAEIFAQNDAPGIAVRGMFAAVSDGGTNRVMTSLSGSTWTARAASAANSWASVCWSPRLGLFAAVASSGTSRVMTSPDGVVWTARTAAEANSWKSICWSPELRLFVAVSTDGTHRVMTSPDGITWTVQTAATANAWCSICWAPALSLFVAVSSGGTNRVMTSPDGFTWTARTEAETNDWRSVCWSPELNLFVAVAFTGTNRVMTSPDGTTWTAQAASANGTTQWISVCWSPELTLFVAVANFGSTRVMTSPDGTTWTSRTASELSDWNYVCWSPELGVLVAVAAAGTNLVMTSSDGSTWVSRSASEATTWRCVCWRPGFVAGPAVGSSDTQVIFNDGGVAAGATVLTWNKTALRLSLTGTVTNSVVNLAAFQIAQTITNNAANMALIGVRTSTLNGSGSGACGLDLANYTFAPSASVAIVRSINSNPNIAPPTGVTITDAVGTQLAMSFIDVLGAVTNSTYLRFISPGILGALKPTNNHAIRIQNQGSSGITASYAIRIDAQSGSASNYAFTSLGTRHGFGTETPDATAIVDVVSTTQGARPAPSMTTTQRDAITSPATGLQIYNTTSGRLNFYDGAVWRDFGAGIGFRADLNGSNQTGFVSLAVTKITFTHEVFDTGGYYDAANAKWIPPAGLVQLQVKFQSQATTNSPGSLAQAIVFKNGVELCRNRFTASVANDTVEPTCFVIDQCNGSDYYEAYARIEDTSGTAAVLGPVTRSFFCGSFLGR